MSFLLNWFWSTLNALGLYQKNAKLILLGLDGAGKTTLLHLLRNGQISAHFPTQRPTMEEVSIGNIRFRAYDMGGHLQARRIWKDYLPEVNAVVFLVDSADLQRYEESKKELDGLLELEEIRDVPFVILANKVDKPEFPGEQQIRNYFGIPSYGGRAMIGRKIELFLCSLVNKQGYEEGFKWISQFL